MVVFLSYWKTFVGTDKRVRIIHGKRTIRVRAIEVILYVEINFQQQYTTSTMACRFSKKSLCYTLTFHHTEQLVVVKKMVTFYHRTFFFFFVYFSPRLSLGSIKSNILQVHWLDRVAFSHYKKIYQNIVHGSRLMGSLIFSYFCLGLASVSENSHLANSLVSSFRYRSVCQIFQNFPNGLSAMAIFDNWPRTDRRTYKMCIRHSLKVNLSISRNSQLFCMSCNKQ